jgi:hypothetical protein
VTDRTAKGRFAPGNNAAVRKAKTAPGSNGVRSYGGVITGGETSRELAGAQKWVTYANAFAFPPVAISLLIRWALSSGAKWSLVENPSGSRDAVRGMEIVEQGLLNATLVSGDTWSEIAAKSMMSYYNGSSLHAAALGRRKDGMVVYTDIAHRPMHTIDRWLSPTNTAPFLGVEQRIPDGGTAKIPLDECLYVVERMLSDDPFGVGVLRLIVERLRRIGKYEALEGSEFFGSLGGLPITRVPLEEMYAELKDRTPMHRDAEITRRTQSITDAVKDRIKTPEKQQYLELDSKTYEGTDSNKITSVKKWDVEILKAQLQGAAEIRRVITDHHIDVARVLHVAFVYIGGGDTKGTHGAHSSMFDAFLRQLQTGLNRTGVRGTHQFARRLVAANGLDPGVACPSVVPEKLTAATMLEALEALGLMDKAALHPKDPVRNIVRAHYDFPDEPEAILDEMRAPRTKVPDTKTEDVDDMNDDEGEIVE